MLDFITGWMLESWILVVEAAPWLLFGFVLAGVVYVCLPVEKVTAHLGKPGIGAVVKASLIGIPLPLCSCSVIPVAVSLRKQGAGRGAFASFLISTPETGVDSIAISYALLGPFLAVVRPIAAFVTALVAGLIIGRGDEPASELGGELVPDVAGDGAACHCCCANAAEEADTSNPSLVGRAMTALRYGLVDLFKDLSLWLLLGFALAGLVSAVVPEGFFERHVGTGLGAMLMILLVSLPLYVCATSSTPVAAALIANGLSPGVALVFLLVGPATNIATMMIVVRDLGRRGLLLYVTTIAVVAILFGLAVDRLLPTLPVQLAALPAHHSEEPFSFGWYAGIVLMALIMNGLRLRVRVRK
jgi:uncharacterized membrane protein YraQ (UPF0718 family)